MMIFAGILGLAQPLFLPALIVMKRLSDALRKAIFG